MSHNDPAFPLQEILWDWKGGAAFYGSSNVGMDKLGLCSLGVLMGMYASGLLVLPTTNSERKQAAKDAIKQAEKFLDELDKG